MVDQEQQAEHEEQVVDAEQNVLDAEAEIRARPLPGRRVGAERHGGAHRFQQVALEPALGVMDADEDVSDRRLEPVDGQRLARDAALAAERAADDEGARGELLLARRGQTAPRRDHRRDRDLDLAARRLLPQEAVDARSVLAELQEAGTHLVGGGGRAGAQHHGGRQHPACGPHQRGVPLGGGATSAARGVPETPGGPGVPGRFSITTR